MFCNQCEQTAKGEGCINVGVCGKQPDVAALQDLLVYGLKGLSIVAVEGREVGVTDDRVNLFTWQPFINYNFDGGWYLTTSPVVTANWEADSDNTWTVPVGGGGGRVFRIGKQPVNCSLQGFYNVEKPDDIGPDWTIRFQFQLLFPKGR